MNSPKALLKRLDEIAQALEAREHTLALIGLGSVGRSLQRLDAYSDLDFFVIVEAEKDANQGKVWKAHYLEHLEWLNAPCPVEFLFRNTPDGYKLLYADGIFAEMAVFEPEELRMIPFEAGRIVWKRPWVDDLIAESVNPSISPPKREVEWLLGEALTNLYVGLAREARGEVLSASRFIQQYAVDRLVELAAYIEVEKPAEHDPFTPERRFEQRFPVLAQRLPDFVQGYTHNRESALQLLATLEANFTVNPAIAAQIRKLATNRQL
jgi:hypothetical protein